MANEIQLVINKLDSYKRGSNNQSEHWSAREIQPILGYDTWRSFEDVIEKAREACRGTGVDPSNQFAETSKMIEAGKGANRKVKDILLSRYACYLIAMNGDSSKPEIATAQGYFAVQTRRMELDDQKTDTQRRLDMRSKVRDANNKLNSAAKEAGVQKFGVFHAAGYHGLYEMSLHEVETKKGITKGSLLDRSGHAELAANYFRITQTEQKISRENIQGERNAINTHHEVGQTVRKTIEKIGGVMPEDLPPELSIKKLEKEQAKKLLT